MIRLQVIIGWSHNVVLTRDRRSNNWRYNTIESIQYDKETEILESNKLDNIDPGYEELLRYGYYPGLSNIMEKISQNGYKLFE